MIVVTAQSLQAEATSTDDSKPRKMHVTVMQDQSPIAISTIAFSWPMHDSRTDDPRGVVLVKDQDIPKGIKMSPECKAVIETLLGLDEVAFVILPPSHSCNMMDIGRLSLADEDAIMRHVVAALEGFNIDVANRTP